MEEGGGRNRDKVGGLRKRQKDAAQDTCHPSTCIHARTHTHSLSVSLCLVRYNLDDGEYDNFSFGVQHRMYSVFFNGEEICESDGDSDVYCYQITQHNVYEPPGDATVPMIVGSQILTDDQNAQLSQLLPNRFFELCYSGAVHGWSASTFHSRCDNKGPTVTVARRSDNGRVFGGYTSRSWVSSNGYAYDYDAFLWTFNGAVVERTEDRMQNPQFAVYDKTTYCPTFGTHLSAPMLRFQPLCCLDGPLPKHPQAQPSRPFSAHDFFLPLSLL